MDLGTVRKNLKKYNSAKEFAVDVRLVFKNCITYNQPGSDIVIMATTLSDIFEKQYAPTKTDLCRCWKTSIARSKTGRNAKNYTAFEKYHTQVK